MSLINILNLLHAFSNDQLAALLDSSSFVWTNIYITNIAQVKAHLINCKAKCVQQSM